MHTSLQQWLDGGQFFPHNGHRIFYRDEGRGPCILLIHGYPTSSYDWQKVWPLLTAHYRVVALDLLGMGFSDKPVDHVYGVSDHADMTDALLAHLGVQQAHVVGHDLGVGVVQELLARRQTPTPLPVIASAVLMNGGIFPEVYRSRRIQKLLASWLGPWLGPRIPKRAFKRALLGMFGPHTRPDDAELDVFWEVLEFNQGRRVTHLLSRAIFARAQLRERLVAPLVDGATPVRLVNGAMDPNSGAHMAARYREVVPYPDVVSLDTVGHWPQWEAPGAVFSAIHEFVQRHPGAAAIPRH